jgi:hypothetical protein
MRRAVGYGLKGLMLTIQGVEPVGDHAKGVAPRFASSTAAAQN